MAFSDMLLDIYSFIHPHLFIMDAVLGLHGEGPAGNGDPIEIGLALASEHGIAMDIAVCKLIGIEPAGIPLLKRAKLRGMWPENIEYPLLEPDKNRINGFRMPDNASYLMTGKRIRSKSPVITEKCIGCGECRRICPKKAVNIVDEIANIDYSKCISCYCCQEICPANAVRLMNIK
jgi:ferredoxin